MNALRVCLGSFVAFGVALGCNGLLGIDDGASGPKPDGVEGGGGPDGTSDNEGGPIPPGDGGTDGTIVVGDGGAAVLADNQAGAISLVQDSANLYWLSDKDIMTVPKAGGVAPRKVGMLPNATMIACDSAATGNVYATVDNEVKLYPKAGGGLGVNVMTLGGGRVVGAMALDSTDLFVLDFNENANTTVVRRAPKGGGASTVISGTQSAVAVLGVDNTSAVWLNEADENTRTVSELKPGASVVTHATASGFAVLLDIRDMALDGTYLYWLDSIGSTSRLRSHLRNNTNTTPVDLANFGNSEGPTAVAVRNGVPYVMVTESPGTKGVVVQVKGGSRPSVITDLESPSSMVVDAQWIYVAENKPFTKATIRKFPHPK